MLILIPNFTLQLPPIYSRKLYNQHFREMLLENQMKDPSSSARPGANTSGS
jgi:hypothetical protein